MSLISSPLSRFGVRPGPEATWCCRHGACRCCWPLQHQGLLDMPHVPVPVVEPGAVGWLKRPAAPYEVLRAGPGLVGE